MISGIKADKADFALRLEVTDIPHYSPPHVVYPEFKFLVRYGFPVGFFYWN